MPKVLKVMHILSLNRVEPVIHVCLCETCRNSRVLSAGVCLGYWLCGRGIYELLTACVC